MKTQTIEYSKIKKNPNVIVLADKRKEKILNKLKADRLQFVWRTEIKRRLMWGTK